MGHVAAFDVPATMPLTMRRHIDLLRVAAAAC
jgi:hypothetical protein